MRHHLFLAIACSFGAGQLALAQQDKDQVILRAHSKTVTAVSFSPNGKTLASADSLGAIKLWDLGTGKETWTISGKKVLIGCIAFSPVGKLLAAGGVRSLKIYDVSSGNELRSFVIKTELYSVAWSPDGKWFCSSGLDGKIRVWDVKTWNEDATLTVHSGAVTSVAFSPQGKLLASAGEDRTIILYEMASWKVLRVLKGHKDTVTSLGFSADGKSLASRSGDGTVKLWAIATGNESTSLEIEPPEGGTSRAMCITADGRLLATGSWNGPISLWDLPKKEKLLSLEGHTESVPSVAFSPNGLLLASASHDRTVRLWDLSKLKK